jgi:hypothetical protein
MGEPNFGRVGGENDPLVFNWDTLGGGTPVYLYSTDLCLGDLFAALIMPTLNLSDAGRAAAVAYNAAEALLRERRKRHLRAYTEEHNERHPYGTDARARGAQG